MGRPTAHDPRRAELPLAYGSRWRSAAVRLAHALLEFPAQAFQAPALMDRAGPARCRDWAVSLEKPTSHLPRDVPHPDVPRWSFDRLWAHRDAAPARERGSISHRGDSGARDQGAASRSPDQDRTQASPAEARSHAATRKGGSAAFQVPEVRRRPRAPSWRRQRSNGDVGVIILLAHHALQCVAPLGRCCGSLSPAGRMLAWASSNCSTKVRRASAPWLAQSWSGLLFQSFNLSSYSRRYCRRASKPRSHRFGSIQVRPSMRRTALMPSSTFFASGSNTASIPSRRRVSTRDLPVDNSRWPMSWGKWCSPYLIPCPIRLSCKTCA